MNRPRSYANMLLAAGFAAACASPAHADNFGFIGAGARSSGMGGAFIGVADDATAIFWNPGGLTHLLQPELSYVGRYDSLSTAIPSALSGVFLTPDPIGAISLNFASAAYPFKLVGRRSAVVAGSVSTLYDFDFNISSVNSQSVTTVLKSQGKISQLSIGSAVDVLTGLSVGASVYIQFGNQLVSEKSTNTSGTLIGTRDRTYAYSGGLAGAFGVYWDASSWLHLGGVVVGGFQNLTIDLKDRTVVSGLDTTTNSSATASLPAGWGIGASMNPIDTFTIALDVRNILWGQYRENGTKPVYSNGIPQLTDAAQLHVGFEVLLPWYVLSDRPVPLRMGFYTDPSATQNDAAQTAAPVFWTVGTGLVTEWGELAVSTEFGTRENPPLVAGIPGTKDTIVRCIASMAYRF